LHPHGLIALIVALAATPLAARSAELSPAAICNSGARGVALSSGALEQAARSAETLLARRGGDNRRGDEALQALELDNTETGVAKAPAVAAYCSAAGESMRLARSGSQFQAQLYLMAAIRFAEQANAPDLSAIASYRLALATVGGPVIADTRGGGGQPARQRAALRAAPAIGPPGGRSCEALSQPDLLSQPSRIVTQVSLSCANARARAAGDPQLAALAGLRLARFLTAIGKTIPADAETWRADGRQVALTALPDAGRIADPAIRVQLLGRLTEAALEAGLGADPRLDQSVADMAAAANGQPEGEAYAAALAGRLAFLSGDAARAQALLRRAVYLESQRPQPLRQADWLLWLAQAEPGRRAELVTEAYRALEAVRPLLATVDPLTEESTFTLRMQPVFEQAVEVQLADRDPTGEAPRIARAQEVVEAYRQAEIQNALGADCVPPREPTTPAELRPGEILLYPVLLGDRIELIYATGADATGAPHYQRLPANRAANRETVARLVAEVVNSTSVEPNTAWRAPARQLYDILIRPIEGELKPTGTLVIVPDGPLRALPFAALLDGAGRFLVARTRISVAPALSYSQPGFDRTKRPLAVVAASLEKAVELPAGYFPKLDGTDAEARVAAGVGGAGDADSRLITNFHKADLQAALSGGRIDVLHVATHAAFNGRSDRSFIVANDEAIPMSDLRGLITANRARGDELDLLVLSACETAVGDDEASMGLAGAAVQAGARSAIASLWEVNDAGTVELMKAFYAGYRVGLSKAEALREAQLKLIAAGGDLAQPNIWAAFTLLGGWR
jgi:CHAT domain-containing protein